MNNIFDVILQSMYSSNARKAFSDFLNALDDPCSKPYQSFFKVLDDIVLGRECNQFARIICKGTVLYRARIIKELDFKNPDTGIHFSSDHNLFGFNEINSKEPPLGIGSAGRNNIKGESFLYLASDEQTACIETKPVLGDLISLATFETMRDIKCFDFASKKAFDKKLREEYDMSLGVFFTELMGKYIYPVHEKNEYKATQIISDYLRKTGVDAIAYRSFFTSNGTNYTVFNCHSSIIKYQESKIVLYRFNNNSFWDFNQKKTIETFPNLDMKYSEAEANELLKRICQSINMGT